MLIRLSSGAGVRLPLSSPGSQCRLPACLRTSDFILRDRKERTRQPLFMSRYGYYFVGIVDSGRERFCRACEPRARVGFVTNMAGAAQLPHIGRNVAVFYRRHFGKATLELWVGEDSQKMEV